MHELTKISSMLERQIADKDSRCLNRFPMEDYTGAVERWPESLPYHYESPEIREIDARIIADHGPGLLEIYHQLALVRLLTAANDKIVSSAMPLAICEAYAESFALIVRDIESKRGDTGRYLMTNPPWTPYWTYLGLAALKIVPVGIRLLIPEIVTVQGSLLERLASRLFSGQEKAWMYCTHLHPVPDRVPGMINREAYRRSFRLSAAMLEFREDFVGLLSTSWFFDPVLPEVSPRFSYLPRLLHDVGAILQQVGSNELTVLHATQASPTRKKLYEEGKYLPTAYCVVIPRDSLIEWARGNEAESAGCASMH